MPKPTITRAAPSKVEEAVKQQSRNVEEEAQAAAVKKAEQAVAAFDQEYQELQEMYGIFQEQYPDAAAYMENIKQQEDIVRECVATAHPLVQAAKETVGDFVCKRKFAQAHYDPEASLTIIRDELVRDMESGALLVKDLLSYGVIKSIKLDPKKSVPWIAQDPKYSKLFSSAFKEKSEMTPAVTTPKI